MSVQCTDRHLIFGSAVLPSLCRAFFLQCFRNITWLPLSCSSAQAGVTSPRHPLWALRALRLALSMLTGGTQCPSELGMRASCLKWPSGKDGRNRPHCLKSPCLAPPSPRAFGGTDSPSSLGAAPGISPGQKLCREWMQLVFGYL